jgi:hypothetical protein
LSITGRSLNERNGLISSRIESALGVEETDVPGVEAPEGRNENYLKDSRPASLDAIQARTEAH